MKAIILVGGFGTRLRPLTLTYPKPLVEFANKPMIQHQIEALASAGVTDVVLAVNYRPEIMAEALKTYEKQYNVKIEFSVETEPLWHRWPAQACRAHPGQGRLALLRPQRRRHLRLPLQAARRIPQAARRRGHHCRHQGRGAVQVRCRGAQARPRLDDRPLR
ncbi:hypothetical protein SNOG_06669 [Parastagonospora nodorum SN15]|uniref:Mannose-1-phosphate guanyltransferase n=1 Tax=Phaeosphaeria nodorum (strain SN15 / ATCC MYA-4574 / FGSC 10173) TaxID=321614 RepID=Q0UNJ5_PHANO|nr:hypothetical protein SNOG_06669 [Parastagonospora nodorum SN15]EAT86500.2 hypothetical protein SNOG_06669 [Parastagonospora nodorum SN15]